MWMTKIGKRTTGVLALLWLLGLDAAPAQAAADGQEDCGADADTEVFREIKDKIGFPNSHKDHLETNEVVQICRDHFCTQYNLATKIPDWVIERLTPDIVTGDNTRPHTSFKPDPKLEPGTPTAKDKDYKGSGLARGHQAASADFKCSAPWMRETFVLSNAVPQVQNGFNGGTWRHLEKHVQDLAKHRKEIFVITGPVAMAADGAETVIPEGANGCGRRIVLAGLAKLKKASICDANDKDPSKACADGVAVPAGLFKIVYIPETERGFAFLMSNEDHRKLKKSGVKTTDYFEEWRATIDVIEEAANLEFFPDRSLRANRVQKEACTETRWR